MGDKEGQFVTGKDVAKNSSEVCSRVAVGDMCGDEK